VGDRSEPDHWFEPLADHLGAAYLRYSFTKGTANEVAFLVDALGLEPGVRVLDVGCGPGRHARALAERGVRVHGVDISQRFVDLAADGAPDGATFERMDGFGLAGGAGAPAAGLDDPDGGILAGMARALRPGGRVLLSAFSAYFQVRYLEDADAFDAATGVNHERTTIKDEQGVDADHDLWTSCFTPRELRLLARAAGLVPEEVWSVTPGDYARRPPDLDHPEFLLLGRRPPS